MGDATPVAEAPAPTHRARAGGAAAFVALVLLGVLHLYPLSLQPTHLHLGRGSADTQEMMWRLAWGVHAVTSADRSIQDANNFYPDEGTYATMDYAYGLIPLTAVFRVFTRDPLALYNLTALASIAIAAWGAFALTRALTGRAVAGVASAAIFAFNPLHLGRIGQLNILAIHWLPWLVLAARQVFERPTLPRAGVLAVTLFLAITSGGHQAVFAAMVLGWTLVVLFLSRPQTRWRSAALSMAAIVAAGALFYPLAKPYLAGASDRNRTRSINDVVRQSPNPSDLLHAESVAHRWLRGTFADDAAPGADDGAKSALFPGIAPCLAMLAGLVVAARRRRERPWAWLFGGLAVGGFLLSLGIHLPGYAFLFEHIGPLHMIRAPSRFTLVALLGMASLAGFAVAAVAGGRAHGASRHAAAAVAAVVLLQWAETFDPVGDDTYRYDPPPPVYRWLAEQPGSFAIVELPSAWQLNAFYLVYSTYHWKDLVNGFNASFMDAYHRRLLFEVLDDFPRRGSREALAEVLGLKYVILHTSPSEPSFRMRGHYHARERVKRALDEHLDWIRPVWSDAGSTVVELVEPADGWVASAHRRVGPGRVLRGRALAFELRAVGDAVPQSGEGSRAPEVVVRLNRAEIARVPLAAEFTAQRIVLPAERVRNGINELRWELAPPPTPPAPSERAIALRRVSLDDSPLR